MIERLYNEDELRHVQAKCKQKVGYLALNYIFSSQFMEVQQASSGFSELCAGGDGVELQLGFTLLA